MEPDLDSNMGPEVCTVELRPSDWKRNEKKAYNLDQPLNLRIIQDPKVRRPGTTATLRFRPFKQVSSILGIWDGYRINDTKVYNRKHRLRLSKC